MWKGEHILNQNEKHIFSYFLSLNLLSSFLLFFPDETSIPCSSHSTTSQFYSLMFLFLSPFCRSFLSIPTLIYLPSCLLNISFPQHLLERERERISLEKVKLGLTQFLHLTFNKYMY